MCEMGCEGGQGFTLCVMIVCLQIHVTHVDVRGGAMEWPAGCAKGLTRCGITRVNVHENRYEGGQ